MKTVLALDPNLTAAPTAVSPQAGRLHSIGFYFFAMMRLHDFLNGPGMIEIVGVEVLGR